MPIIDHVSDCALDLEKYKAMQNVLVYEDRNHEDCNFSDNFIP